MIKLYEDNTGLPVDLHRVEYFIVSSEGDENTDNLDELIADAIREEVSMYKEIPRIINEVHNANNTV